MQTNTILPGDAGYPAGVRALEHPPVLRLRGALGEGRRVAVVGTRTPTPAGERFAFELASELATAGIEVWSGGALGIDSAAHRGAVAGGGRTVVVLGSGIDRPYPAENAVLFDELARSGSAVVSPFADGMEARRPLFFARNGVLAAASDALVVVECAVRSGALNAAGWCRKLGKPVGAVPHAPWEPRGAGCLDLLARGYAAMVSTPAQVLALIGVAPRPAPPASRQLSFAAPAIADPFQLRIVEALVEPRALAELAESLASDIPVLAGALLELQLAGAIEESIPGVFRRSGAR